MEALEDHHRFWPELEADPPRARRVRHASSRPLLSLGMGPLSLPLLPPLAPLACDREAEAPPVAGTAAPPSSAAATPVQQLAAALEQADPGLVARLAATGERADAAFFQRWLHAHGSVEAAAAAIQAHAAWRTAFVGVDDGGAAGALGAGAAATPAAGALPPLGRGISEASIADELAARKVFLQGLDAGGCPVVVVQASRHDMGRRNLAHTKRLIAYVLDSACSTADLERNPSGRICCLFDLAGLRPRNLDVKALLAIFELLQDHYPERLDSLYFLSAPWLFWGVWRVVSPFVQPATRQKIHFVSGAEGRRQLLARMPPQVLPARYGGAAELFPIDGAMTAWRREQAAAAAVDAASTASTSSSGSGGSGRRSRAASALRRGASATRSFVHHRLVRPVGGAAAGAARALRGHHAHLLARRHGMGHSLPPEQQRSLLAQVVLTHVLLVGLLLRMLQRVLLLRGPAVSAGAIATSSSGKQASPGSKVEPAAGEGGSAASPDEAAAPAGPADT